MGIGPKRNKRRSGRLRAILYRRDPRGLQKVHQTSLRRWKAVCGSESMASFINVMCALLDPQRTAIKQWGCGVEVLIGFVDTLVGPVHGTTVGTLVGTKGISRGASEDSNNCLRPRRVSESAFWFAPL
jgi:hypothetical protein